jgi:predicted dehydrogenase
MRLAIIGCGSIGMRHLKNALALGCEVIVADSDSSREDAAIAIGAREMTAATAEGVDAVMVCTPYDLHLGWAEWAIQHRAALFVEKPLGSLDQIEDWRRLVEQSRGLVTQVGYQLRFHEVAIALKQRAGSGHQLFSVECDMGAWPGRNYGPFLLEAASHEIDLALWMGIGQVQSARLTDTQAWLACDRGSVTANVSAPFCRRWVVNGHAGEFHKPEELGDQMYVDELKHFLDCVQSGRQTDVPLSDGLRVLEVCKQVEEMAGKSAIISGAHEC